MCNILNKRPFNKGLFYFLFLIVISFLYGYDKPLISVIELKGNLKTKAFILNREIEHPLHIPLDSSLANSDRNRLENLGLFSQVIWITEPLADGSIKLVYTVVESIYKVPPIALPTYNEDYGWSITGVWSIKNFMGRNQNLSIGGSIGAEDTYGFSFSDPWIFGNHVSLGINIGRTLYKHRFLDREIDVNNFSVKFGRWFGRKIKSMIGLDIEEKKYFNEKSFDVFNYYGLLGSIKYDTRDIFWSPGKGVLFSHSLYYRKGIYPEDFQTTLWSQSYSTYFKINKSGKKRVLALNTKVKRKLGIKNEFFINYIGNSTTIRGWDLPDSNLFYSQLEPFRFGHESLQFSIEIRQDIIPKKLIKTGIEFGLTVVAFYDFGMITDDWKNLKEESLINGIGAGIRIPFPIVGVIRLDYGFGFREGVFNSGSLHLGIGQKF